MRSISFEEYNKKRKSSKLDFLKMRDKLEKKSNNSLRRRRDKEKRILLYRLAKTKKENTLRKVGEREYQLIY